MLHVPNMESLKPWAEIGALDLELPLEEVDAINMEMEAEQDADDVYADDQYEDEYIVVNRGN